MTAEIAIFNKRAVALASDSAVTIRNHNSSPKIYTSVNKLFQMSKYNPVGIMIYGSAEFMDYPWEVIIKEHRRSIGSKSYKSLYNYGNDFLNHLKKTDLFSDKCQEDAVVSRAISFFNEILQNVEEEIKEKLKAKKDVTEKDAMDILRKELSLMGQAFIKTKYAVGFDSNDTKIIKNNYRDILKKVLKKVFEKLPLTNTDINNILNTVSFIYTKDLFPRSISGVVVAGFGDKDIFPSFIEYNFDLVVNNKPKYRVAGKDSISLDTTAIIRPFAQSEMVHLFIEGIDPLYHNHLSQYLEAIFKMMPTEIAKIIPNLKENEKIDFIKKITNANDTLFKELIKHNDKYRKNHHSSPILETVSSLPHIEIAEMAESLVSLTSFKRRMSLDAETVGGPTDVALITKGDGFIWIKRKHYFKPELNHHFFDNYYQ
jgi:hypothetical protein